MFEKYYSINEVFISKFGYWAEDRFDFFYPTTCYIIVKSGKRYKAIAPKGDRFYPQFEKCSDEEKENCCLWGKLDSVYPYLNENEIKIGKISVTRLYEIHDNINGVVYVPGSPKKVGKVLAFRPR